MCLSDVVREVWLVWAHAAHPSKTESDENKPEMRDRIARSEPLGHMKNRSQSVLTTLHNGKHQSSIAREHIASQFHITDDPNRMQDVIFMFGRTESGNCKSASGDFET